MGHGDHDNRKSRSTDARSQQADLPICPLRISPGPAGAQSSGDGQADPRVSQAAVAEDQLVAFRLATAQACGPFNRLAVITWEGRFGREAAIQHDIF